MTPFGFLLFLVLACATFRLAELVVFDNAPFHLLLRLRTWTHLYDHDALGDPFYGANAFQRWLGGLLDCPHCAGVYLAFFGALAWLVLVSPRGELELYGVPELVLWFVVVWWALAGLQSALEIVAGRARSE